MVQPSFAIGIANPSHGHLSGWWKQSGFAELRFLEVDPSVSVVEYFGAGGGMNSLHGRMDMTV